MQSTGCAVAGSHACGDHWGNADAVAANAALFDALKDMVNVSQDRIGLMGGGLGGALVWNSVLGPLAGSVKCVVVMQAASSLEGVIRERKFRSPLLAAYSLPEDTSDEEAIAQVAPHDPLPRFQKLARGARLPRTAIYHGAKDENLPPHIHATPLAEALKKAGGEVKLELFLGVGHAVYAMGKDIETHLKSFFSSSLGVGTGQHLKTEQSRRRA